MSKNLRESQLRAVKVKNQIPVDKENGKIKEDQLNDFLKKYNRFMGLE